MPRGMKRSAPVDVERPDCVVGKQHASSASRSPDLYEKSHTRIACETDEESPTHTIGYHLVDHVYGVTPKHQITHGDPLVPPKTSQAVKRRLNMNEDDEIDNKPPPPLVPFKADFKTPKSKRSSKGQTNSWRSPSSIKKITEKNSRYDASLSLLTKKFVHLLRTSPNGVINLNTASTRLEVQKRRIYDITNVLEGIGILEKKSKNNIQWKLDNSKVAQRKQLARQLRLLKAKEEQLDDAIAIADKDFRHLKQETRYAYITYNDIKGLSEFKDQTVIPIKAPPAAQVMAHTPDDKQYSIKFTTDSGEIEVFLCHKTESPLSTPGDISNTPIIDAKFLSKALDDVNNHSSFSLKPITPLSPFVSPKLRCALSETVFMGKAQRNLTDLLYDKGSSASSTSNSNKNSVWPVHRETVTPSSSSLEIKTERVSPSESMLSSVKTEPELNEQIYNRFKNALISNSDDFDEDCLQFQTEDQNMPDSIELDSFLKLEPPLSDYSYTFTLDHDESLKELFDTDFQ